MYFELTNSPTVPVSLADAKEYLRVDFTKDDNVITNLIASSVSWGEGFCNKDFSTKEWRGFYDSACFSNAEIYPYLSLDKDNVQSVTSVEISVNGSYETTSEFIYKPRGGFDRILLTDDVTIDNDVAYTFRVVFSSGYSTLPDLLKNAILETIAFLYENRGDAPSLSERGDRISGLPSQIHELYRPFRNIAGYA